MQSQLANRGVLSVAALAWQDVAWHSKHEFMFGSVGDDKQLILWDTRCHTIPSCMHSHVPGACSMEWRW